MRSTLMLWQGTQLAVHYDCRALAADIYCMPFLNELLSIFPSTGIRWARLDEHARSDEAFPPAQRLGRLSIGSVSRIASHMASKPPM